MKFVMPIPARLVLLAVAILLATSCAKKKECTALTSAIQQQRKSYGGDASSADDFVKMAATYKKAGEAIAAVDLVDPTLKKEQSDYLALLDDLESAAMLTAKAKSPQDFPESDKYAAIAISAKKATAKLAGRSEKEMYLDVLKNCAE